MLILGTAQLQAGYGARADESEFVDPAAVRSLLSSAIRLGFEAIDTAPSYGDAEQVIGTSDSSMLIHTKLDPRLPAHQSLERSLQRLRRERVAVLYFHDPDVLVRDRARVDEAHRLVGAGTERLGASIYDADALATALEDSRIGAVQAPMSLLDRRIPLDLLARAHQQGVEVYARSILFQGLLTAPLSVVEDRAPALLSCIRDLRAISDASEIPILRLAVVWVRDLLGVTGLVLGANRVAELGELSAAWSSPPLPRDVSAVLAETPTLPAKLADLRSWDWTR